MKLIFSFCLLLNLCNAYTKETLSESPRLFLFKNFLTSEECDHIIALAQPQLLRSQVIDENRAGGEMVDYRRTSRGMFFPQFSTDRILKSIEDRISALTGIPLQNGEGIQVLHYNVGGEYQPHYDYFHPNTPGGQANLARGGQRVATFIMYLHTTPSGGETIFPLLNLRIAPQKGSALLFYNCTPEGVVDPRTLHGGAPVIAGEKWIATRWLHERAFR
jgi:prolyl 4-hydroxylase